MLQLETPLASCRYEAHSESWAVVVKHAHTENFICYNPTQIGAEVACRVLNHLFNLPSKAPERPEAPSDPDTIQGVVYALESNVAALEAQVAALDGRLGCVEQFIKTL